MVFAEFPDNWKECGVRLAQSFSWQPSEIYALTAHELLLWLTTAAEVAQKDEKEMKANGG